MRFERRLLLAGLQPWPKQFQNLRSTRQTELSIQGFAPHIVCAWIGNTEAVANKHYLQVPESEFLRAAGLRACDSNSGERALQNPVQHTPVSGRMPQTAQQEGLAFAEKCEALPCCTNEQAPFGEPRSDERSLYCRHKFFFTKSLSHPRPIRPRRLRWKSTKTKRRRASFTTRVRR